MFDHAVDLAHLESDGKRTFLFLQGPASPFFPMLADALAKHGHDVHRINLCFGDRMFWTRSGAVNYSGKMSDWPNFVSAFLIDNKVTDIVMFGDRRPYHVLAAEKARALDINVNVIEHGYVRPSWITLERDGMSAFSHFPKDPATIRKMARNIKPADLTESFGGSFRNLALWDLKYYLSSVFLWPFHPHYQPHAIYHPLAEYAGWVRKFLSKPVAMRRRKKTIKKIYTSGKPFYLFPLQLQTDFQLRDNSPFPDQQTPIRKVIGSFARKAREDAILVIKIHPFDSGLVNWRKYVERVALEHKIANRVVFIDGGNLNKLLKRSSGVVTINSTVGTLALSMSLPLKVLGSAVYDIDGLTFSGPLNDFWDGGEPPDTSLWNDFLRVLSGTIQVKGGFYAKDALVAAVRGAAERLDKNLVNMPRAVINKSAKARRFAAANPVSKSPDAESGRDIRTHI